MVDLMLEPYADRQHWRALSAVPWQEILGEYLEGIARRCAKDSACVIGHIKGLALFPNGCFLRWSVVSAGRPADVQGAVPAGTAKIELALNVIVYGLSRARIEHIVREEALALCARRKGVVQFLNEEANE